MAAAANERRLAAIMAADVVGYSAMIGTDEATTMARVRTLRAEVIEPLTMGHEGRVFKTTGDGFLVAFASAVQALRCAVAIQDTLRARNDGLRLRIGVHQGEVVPEGDDLLGDGVIVAARLEPLAEPGGICISGRVREDAAGKIPLEVEDLGEPALKNMTQKVRVFRVRLRAAEPPVLVLPDKPSVAVLPFQNMSADPEQEYFADGMAEEIITGLSRVRSFFVIARNSSFSYKSKSPDVRQVGRELGVRYVLEGSVRKAGNRVRITGQLVDAASGAHLWADRFDGTLDDIFDLQDQVTGSVVTAIEPKIRSAEIERAQRKPTESLQAYDLLLRAQPHLYLFNPEGFEAAAYLLRQAVDIDPTYSLACAYLAFCYWIPWQQGWTVETRPSRSEVVRLIKTAVRHGGEDPEVLATAAFLTAHAGGDVYAGLALAEKALTINPNSALALQRGGQLLAYIGDTKAAIDYLERSARLNPLGEARGRNFALAIAHFVAGSHEAAADFSEKVLRETPNSAGALLYRASSLGLLGRIDEGRQAVQQLRAIALDWTVSSARAHLEIELHNIFKTPGVVDAICEGLRRAGLPE